MNSTAAGRVAIMGLNLARLTEAETNRSVVHALEEGYGGWVCPVNLDVMRQIVHNEELRELVDSADLVVTDGMPLVWASRILGAPLPERVAGSSLISTLSAELGARGRSVYLLGGNEGTAEVAGARLHERFSGLAISGWHCPPFGFERSTAETERIISLLRSAQPDVVFVGLGFPKQDRLIVRLRPVLPSAWFVSCGVSFSFLTGDVHRAPRLVQALGFEWVHRLAQEPRRLAKRYLVQDLPFAVRLFATSIHRRIAMEVQPRRYR